MYFFYGKVLKQGFGISSEAITCEQSYDIKPIRRLAPILALVIMAFFLSSLFKLEIPLIALACGALVLVVGQVKPSNIIKEVDWVLLLFFAGLFIVIEGAHKAGVLDVFIERVVSTPNMAGIVSISLISTLVSQLVSNVPLTMLLLPILKNVRGHTLWIALAAGSTLGGNLTIIGAVANIIVIEEAAREGIHVKFVEFLKVGTLVTAITVGLSILILGGEYWIGWLK